MAGFVRSFPDNLIAQLQNEKLFTDKLLPDMRPCNEAVFPAIRKEEVSFYYKGGRLFAYNIDGFKTNIKYGVIPEFDSDYITETKLNNVTISVSFYDKYKAIKERCKKYGNIEAEFVSGLYGVSGLANSQVILLDTEIALYDEEDKDRIDLLLYDKLSRKLCFCEAKHFSNPEIWATEGSKPAVCNQTNRYNAAIQANKKDIITQYTNYINAFNKLFNTDLPTPTSLHDKTGLLIFGFDSFQREKIKKLLIDDGSLDGISNYRTGKLECKQICTLFNKITKP